MVEGEINRKEHMDIISKDEKKKRELFPVFNNALLLFLFETKRLEGIGNTGKRSGLTTCGL